MGEIIKKFCFKDSGGEDIYLFTLNNNRGTEVSITNYGATITSFKILQKDGTQNNIVLGFDRIECYLDDAYKQANPYFGAAIGRYANRIGNAEIHIKGIRYPLTKNNLSAQLHGGLQGFDKKFWKEADNVGGSPTCLELECLSFDGEEGFPGELKVTIRFELNDNDELSYEYFATTTKTTPINLTHHSYFNLGKTKTRIDQHFVRIASTEILSQDENLVANGELINVSNTVYDFRKCRQINSNWIDGEGYDQSFLISNNNQLSPVAEAYCEESGINLQIFTEDPIVHFYTGKWIPQIKLNTEFEVGPFFGLCLETQFHPNAVNLPHFPNTLLLPGEHYHTKTTYRIVQI